MDTNREDKNARDTDSGDVHHGQGRDDAILQTSDIHLDPLTAAARAAEQEQARADRDTEDGDDEDEDEIFEDEEDYEDAEDNDQEEYDGEEDEEQDESPRGAEGHGHSTERQKSWGGLDEPQLEFDEMGVELSCREAEMSALEGTNSEFLHNLHLRSSTLYGSQELEKEEKDQPFRSGAITPDGFIEEDFEEELGSPTREDEDNSDPNIEYRDIAKYGIVEVAGDDTYGRKVIVFSACRLPPHHDLDHQRFLQYLRHTLDQYVESDYTLVYFHYGLTSRNKPSFAWLRQAYKEFDRKYKKNLKALYLVHPTNFLRVMWNIFRPIISIKFGKKVMYLNYLHELAKHVQLDQLRVPQRVKDYDALLLAKNKPQPVPTSIIHAPLPTQQFGVTLEYIKQHNNGELIPPVVKQCVSYIRDYGLSTEGIFRRSASASLLRDVQKRFNMGRDVNFDDPHVPAAILKSFLRQLPEPLLTFDLYDHIIRVQTLDHDEREIEMRRLLSDELPEDNYFVLKYIMHFLTEVVQHCGENRMTSKNLAIVFGPNLVWTKSMASLTSLGYVNSCAEYLIVMYHNIFVK